MTQSKTKPTALRYCLDRSIRRLIMTVMNRLSPDLRGHQSDFQPQQIKRILVVRSVFRMGSLILATPAIQLLHKNFPAAQIDFVGPAIAKQLFANLPIDRHYEITRRFPHAGWRYPVLLKNIRAAKYDLAFDASGSSSALGSFIVGFSAARLRVGVRGKWDRWFNLTLDRPRRTNKYDILPKLIAALGLEIRRVYPELHLAPEEIAEGKTSIRALGCNGDAPTIGVFVGGRKTRGKRWEKEKFAALAALLRHAGAQPVIFVGPEEREWLGYFQRESVSGVPTAFESDVRKFASLVANCDVFVTCDGGPMHLACALRVRTVSIFLTSDVRRWAPPSELGRIIVGDVGVDSVFDACREELRNFSRLNEGRSYCSYLT